METPVEDVLYAILPYFNFAKSKRRLQLFNEFVDRYSNITNLKLVIIEASLEGEEHELAAFPNVSYHFKYHVKHQLWIKENLINVAIEQLPSTWKYVAWIDADITFLNKEWVNDTIAALSTEYDVLQPFHTGIHMGPDNEALKIERSFGYMHLRNGHDWIKTHKYGFWHPGFAWAIKRTFYEHIGGLLEFGILGSGDHHMSLAFINKVDNSRPDNIDDSYKSALREFETKAKCARLGYIKGTILHHWHGRLEDRKYVERWKILSKNKYNPFTFITKTASGLLELTNTGAILLPELCSYFSGRNEDNMAV